MVTWGGGVTTDSSDLVKLSNGRDKGLRGGDVGGVTTDSSDLVKLSNGRDKGLRGGDVGG